MANDSESIVRSAGGMSSLGAGAASGSEVDLRQLLDLFRAGRWTIAIVVALTIGLVGLYCLWVAPIYQADGLVQIEQSSGKGGVPQQLSEISSLVLGSSVETQAEIQVLRSRMVLNQIIDKLNLQILAQPKYFPLLGAAIVRAKKEASEPVSVPAWLRKYAWGGEKITVSTWEVPDEYLNKAFTLVKTADGFAINRPDGKKLMEGGIGQTVTANAADGTYTAFVRELKAETGTQFKLIRYSRQDILAQLIKMLQISEQGKQSGVITISFQSKSPDEVTDVINTLEEAYLRQNVERRSANAQQSLEYLQKQLPQLKDQVDQAQLKLNSYQSLHGSVDVTQETQLVLKQTVDLESQRLHLAQQRDELMQRFTAQHPTVKALDEQIQSLDSAQGKVKQQVGKLPNTQQEIFSLLRDLDVSNELYAEMLNSIQELQVAKAGTVGNVRIVDRALKPLKPISPKVPMLLAVSVFVGLILGMGIVLVQRTMLRGVDDPAQVESQLGLITYAMVPFSSRQRQLNRSIAKREKGQFILAGIDAQDVAIESLRSLRTSLHFAMLEARNNVLMLTGPAPELGKSFVSLNLGAVLALSGKKVVTVDADLRRGHLHLYVAAQATPGISEFVTGEADFSAVVHPSPIKGLDIVFRGTSPPNPSELLLHERFAALIVELSANYDYVIVDTPPVLAVTDAAIVGQLAGSALLVLKSAEHSIREIEETVKRLSTAGISLKGVIFNQVGARAGSYGYGNYGYTNYRYDSTG